MVLDILEGQRRGGEGNGVNPDILKYAFLSVLCCVGWCWCGLLFVVSCGCLCLLLWFVLVVVIG